MSKRNITAEKCVLQCKLGQIQKNREITASHLYQELDQSTKGFMFDDIKEFAKANKSKIKSFPPPPSKVP